MFQRSRPWLAVALILGAALALLWKPMQKETATNDESVFLGAGWSYWHGHRYYLNPEHPPLMQLWSALPSVFMDAKPPAKAEQFFDDGASSLPPKNWEYNAPPGGTNDFSTAPYYRYPAVEAGLFGRMLLYDGTNNADRLLFWGRFMQALVFLATGLIVLLWARSLAGTGAGLLALATWTFNPIALAYGHLVITDPGITLTLPLAVWTFSRFLKEPQLRTAILAGLCFGVALLTKYTAIILVPVYAVLITIRVWHSRKTLHADQLKAPLRHAILFLAVAWGLVLLLYFPNWSPPPPISIEDAADLKVPAWFLTLRPILIPRDYFKGITIMSLHVVGGHLSYLMGQWSKTGWWYYYPTAILVKTPVALLLLIGSALVMAFRRAKSWTCLEATPLLAAAIYLGCAMTNKADIGIRHILPIYPLLAVVVGTQYAKSKLSIRIAGLVLAIWLATVAVVARTDYIAYFNELVGGPANGQNYLVDSNFDWGQNGQLLKVWMEENHVPHVYLDYFGTGLAIDHLGISRERVKPSEVKALTDGYFVVSATNLMRADYDWLRQSHSPIARIGYTLFVYKLPVASN